MHGEEIFQVIIILLLLKEYYFNKKIQLMQQLQPKIKKQNS